MRNIFFFTLIAFAFFSACKEEEEEPSGYPYRFHCKVNGVLWEAKYRIPERILPVNDLDVSLSPLDKDTSLISIRTYNIVNKEYLTLGFFTVSDTTKISKNYFESCFSASNKTRCAYDYKIDSTQPNRIDILDFNYANKVIKGKFQFTLIPESSNCQDTLHITDGYFDVKFYIE